MVRAGRSLSALSATLAAAVVICVGSTTAQANKFVPAPGSPYGTGNEPYSVNPGNFSADLLTDLAVVNGTSGTVQVFNQQPGDGGFALATGSPFNVGGGPNFAAVADFNGDLRQDLAVANFSSGNVSVMLQQPDGTFSAEGGGISVGGNLSAIGSGDFNGDGKQDIAVAEWGSHHVFIYLRKADNTGFIAGSNVDTGGTHPRYIAVGDLDGVGGPDIAVTNSGSGTVAVLLDQPGGSFAPATHSPFSVGGAPQFVAIAPLNGDAMPDIAVANNSDDNVSVLDQQPGGDFQAATGSPFAVGHLPVGIAAADFRGSGHMDLAVADSGSQAVTILQNDGTTFTRGDDISVAPGVVPYGIATGQFNDGDTLPDIAVTSIRSAPSDVNYLSVFINQLPPATTTRDATGIGADTVKLNATVNPRASSTLAHFEYGPTTAYGSVTGDIPLGPDRSDHAISSDISGLSPGTTYHFRIVAANAAGSSSGDDLTFTTASSSPPPPPPTPRNLTPPELQVEGGSSRQTYTCSDGTWEGLASDPQFVHEIWEKSTSVSIFSPGDKYLSSGPVSLSNTANPRLYYCLVFARTNAGDTISAQSSDVQVPSPPSQFHVHELNPRRTGDFRIRGIDVFQVTQPNSGAQTYAFNGVPQRANEFPTICGAGTPTSLELPLCVASGAASQTAAYKGVILDPDKPTSAVVYVDRKPGDSVQVPDQPIVITLRMQSPGRVNARLRKTVTAGSLPSSSSDAIDSEQRGDEKWGVRFDIPQSWLDAAVSPTNGSFDLTATARISGASPALSECSVSEFDFLPGQTNPCAVNDSFKLTDVPARSLPFSPIFWTIALPTPGQAVESLKDPQTVLQTAREVLPGGENFQVLGYIATVPIDPANAVANCGGAPDGETAAAKSMRLRDCALTSVENTVNDWATHAAPATGVTGTGYHVLVGVHDYQYLPGKTEPGAEFGSAGVGFFGRRGKQPKMQINDLSLGRPLTSATHELGHAFGLPHAGKNIGGIVGDRSCGGDLNGQVGELWPGDESGRLQGVQFDPATGDRTVDSDIFLPTAAVQPLWDLMSYCTGDATAWLSPRNWNRAFSAMINAETDAVQSPKLAVAAASSAGTGYVSGAEVGGVARILQTEPADPGNSVPPADPSSPLRVRAFDASGKLLAEVGATLEIDRSTGSFTFMAPTPPGTARVELVQDGVVVDSRARSRPPTLRLIAPGRGVHARKQLIVRWAARDPDKDALTASIEFLPDGKRASRTIYYGPSTGHVSLPAGMLQAGPRARVRLRVTDGFKAVEALSHPIRVDGPPPVAAILRPLSREGLSAGAPVTLQGQAHDDAGKFLRGRSLTWYAGRRRLGTGAKLRVKLRAGRFQLRLVARDSRGRTSTIKRTVRVAPVPLEIVQLSAPNVRHGAKTTTVTVATSVPGTLTIRGHRFTTGSHAKRHRITLPSSPKSGVIELPVQVKAKSGGRAVKTTLIVLRG